MLKDKITKTSWPDLVFMAEAHHESFQDLKITTLKSQYEEKVFELAWAHIQIDEGKSEDNLTYKVEERAKTLMENRSVYVKEFVKVDEDYNVEVCVDKSVITDIIVEEVLDMLTEIGIKPNTVIEFGDAKSFSCAEIKQHKQVNSSVGKIDNTICHSDKPLNEMYSYIKGFVPF